MASGGCWMELGGEGVKCPLFKPLPGEMTFWHRISSPRTGVTTYVCESKLVLTHIISFFLLRFRSIDQGWSLSQGVKTERTRALAWPQICPKKAKVLYLQLNRVIVIRTLCHVTSWNISVNSGILFYSDTQRLNILWQYVICFILFCWRCSLVELRESQ